MLDTTYIEKITGFSETTIESVVEGLIKFIQFELRAGNEVRIEELGTFYPKELGNIMGTLTKGFDWLLCTWCQLRYFYAEKLQLGSY